MLTLVTGRLGNNGIVDFQPHKDDGFSLIETLMVITIIGMMVSAVVFVMPGNDNKLESRLASMQRHLVAIARESTISGKPIGVRYTLSGYTVLGLVSGQWQPTRGLIRNAGKQWPGSVHAKLSVLGEDIELNKKPPRKLIPHIWFLPTGEVPVFELKLVENGKTGTLSSGGLGKFKVQYE